MILDPSNKNMSPGPYFPKMKPRLFIGDQFFWDQVFRNRDETFYRDQIFWNQNPPKMDKSLETENFRNQNVTLWKTWLARPWSGVLPPHQKPQHYQLLKARWSNLSHACFPRRGGQKIVGEERIAITKLSTFKPKPLRNPAPSKDTLYTQGNVLPSKKK